MDTIPGLVLIIESHPLMREALCTAIADEPDLRVGLQVSTGIEALQMLKAVRPDIILFSLGNPGWDELEVLPILRKSLPDTPILAFTSNEVEGQEQAALKAGACAVLAKVASRSELIGVLRDMCRKTIKEFSQGKLCEEVSKKLSL